MSVAWNRGTHLCQNLCFWSQRGAGTAEHWEWVLLPKGLAVAAVTCESALLSKERLSRALWRKGWYGPGVAGSQALLPRCASLQLDSVGDFTVGGPRHRAALTSPASPGRPGGAWLSGQERGGWFPSLCSGAGSLQASSRLHCPREQQGRAPRPAASTSPGNWSDAWAPPRPTESEALGVFNKPWGGFQCLFKSENTGAQAPGSEGSEFRSQVCPGNPQRRTNQFMCQSLNFPICKME